MSGDSNFYSLKSFKKDFKSSNLNIADYLHHFFHEHGLPSDVSISLLRLISPFFILRKEILLLRDFYNKREFLDLCAKNRPHDEVIYWSNMIDLTDVFNCEHVYVIKEIADGLVVIWNKKLNELGYQNIAEAICYLDSDECVYITLRSPPV